MAYLLDANVFISAKNLHYGLDFCPAFWDWIIANNANGVVIKHREGGRRSPSFGRDELSSGADARAPVFLSPARR